jgi:hypothetical protein
MVFILEGKNDNLKYKKIPYLGDKNLNLYKIFMKKILTIP